MKDDVLSLGEKKLADLIWDREPIRSGDLVSLCLELFAWKKSTTFTVLRKICAMGYFANEDSVVTSTIRRDEYEQKQSQSFVDKNFEGSLPRFLAAFTGQRKISDREMEEMLKMIREYPEESHE